MPRSNVEDLQAEIEKLRAENEDLRIRREEAEGALEAIRTGQVESLVVEGPDGPRIFSLEGANHSYRVLVEAMNEGAATLAEDGTILYSNACFARMLETPLHQLTGGSVHMAVTERFKTSFTGLMREATEGQSRGEVVLQTRSGKEIFAHVSISALEGGPRRVFCLVATDLTQQQQELDTTLSSMSEALLVFDADARVVRANAAATRHLGFDPVGLERSELARRTKLTWLDGREVASEELPSVHTLRGDVFLDKRMVLAVDGEPRVFSVSSAPLRAGERITGAVSVWHDITAFERSQDALRTSESRYRALFDNLPDAAFLTKTDGRILAANPAAQRMFGMTEAEIVQSGRTALVDIASPSYRAAIEERERAGRYANREMSHVRKSGERFPTEVSSVVLPGGSTDAFVIVRDITERKRSEEDLKRSEERFRSLVLASSEITFRVSPDWSEMRQLHGRDLPTDVEVSSRTWLQAYIPRAEQPRVSAAISEAIRAKRTLELEHRVRAKDGSPAWVFSRAVPLLNAQGEILEWFGAASDITARKRAEEALRESESRLRRLWDSGMIGVLHFDLSGAVADANDKFLQMVGYSRADLAAGLVDWSRMTPPEYRAHDQRALAEIRESGVDTPYEKEFIRKDGSRVWVLIGGALFDNEHHRGIAFVVDIGERKRIDAELKEANERLLDADQRKNDFLAMLSHELRNPLAPISNSVYIMGRAAAGGEQFRRAVSVIDRQVTHMARLIDDLLDVTRIARGKIRLQRESLLLDEIVRGAAEDHREQFRRNGIELEVVVTPQPLRVFGDRTRIAQIVDNLLGNAAKFTHSGGRAELSLEARDGGEAVIQVLDTGVGLEPGIAGKLFEPFMQADKTLDRSRGGLGLGLALVKGLAELHGGSVSATSDGPGMGAVFTVRLPIEAQARPQLSVVSPTASSGRCLRVLVIEDNQDAARSLKDVLELGGHAVEVAFTGPDGVRLGRTVRPDVVICDIGLPELDGYAVAKVLRGDAALRHTFLVALSGYAGPEDLERSKEAGFDEHIAKPPSIEAIERLLARVPAPPSGTNAGSMGSLALVGHE